MDRYRIHRVERGQQITSTDRCHTVYSTTDPDGEWVRYVDAQVELAELKSSKLCAKCESALIPKGETMPMTSGHFYRILERNDELMDEMKAEISSLKVKLNKEKQRKLKV